MYHKSTRGDSRLLITPSKEGDAEIRPMKPGDMLRVPNIWKTVKNILTPAKGHPERTRFSLGRRPIPGEMPPKKKEEGEKTGGKRLSKDLDENARVLKELFHVPESSDVVFREILSANPKVRVVVAYVEGMSAFDKLFRCVLQPLMLLSPIRKTGGKSPVDWLEAALLPNGQIERTRSIQKLVESMLMGDTVVLVEKSDIALVVETKGWEHRQVGEAVSERIVRGPQQGFVEVLRSNTALLRSIIQSPDLVVESLDIGVTANTKCALIYMSSIANPKLVDECRRRILSLDVSEIFTSGELEQFIEDTHTLLPTILSTERPDRVATHLMQGMCSIMVSGDPFALIVPVNVFTFLHSAEDRLIRWPYGNVLRIIRYISFFLTVYLPGLYVAIVNYHPEMVPSAMMMAIAASREPIPFPLYVEVLLMFFAFELIREAGIRIPSPIGPTIGIVGAILIGEAAVTASIVSPILVIIIAVTAVASFTLPNLEIGMFIRVATLLFIVAGSVLGLLGIVALTYVMLCHAFALNSFGVPFLTPLAPMRQPSYRGAFVSEPWKVEGRPSYIHPKDVQRLGRVARLWDAGATLHDDKPKGRAGDGGGQGAGENPEATGGQDKKTGDTPKSGGGKSARPGDDRSI
jgi:spore germination protein KA